MKESDEFYLKNLYPFQDGILNIVKELNLPFYLTGGTALSRFYFNHRYSDDLDLFVNSHPEFNSYIELFYKSLLEKEKTGEFEINNQRTSISENFAQFYVSTQNAELRVDLVNDIAPHFGEMITDQRFGMIDSLRNILSNKLSAIFRFEPKDIADIWIICRHFDFKFRDIINEAKNKEVGIDPVTIYEILTSFPIEKINLIKWVEKPSINTFKEEIGQIAEDLLYGRENSLKK